MKKYLAIAAVALTLIACGTSPESSKKDVDRLNNHANGSPQISKTITALSHLTAGSWEVGKKDDYSAGIITPGTYIVTVPENGANCYWETVKSFDDTLSEIIANDNVSPGSTVRVVVKASYAGLNLKGQCLAQKKTSKSK